jgi:hypothetical protein
MGTQAANEEMRKHQLFAQIPETHDLCLLRGTGGIKLCSCALLSFHHLCDPANMPERRRQTHASNCRSCHPFLF